MPKKFTKRQFLRTSLTGIGAAVAGIPAVKAMEGILAHPLPPELPPAGGLGKFSRESPYSVATPKGIKCQICPNNCILKEGADSICRTHVVKDGKLYTVAYGNPCSVHAEPVEKKPLFHFLPSTSAFSIATAGCNFACLNCQNWEISQKSPWETQNMEMFPPKVVEEASKAGCRSIAYTYSEPIAWYEYAFDTAKLARSKGIKNLLISNGFINEKPLRDLCKHLDAANINLKSFSDDIYARLNGGTLQPVLNTLKTLKAEGVWLEITNLVVPGWTDDLNMIREMCGWLVQNDFADTPLHFSRFFPLHKLTNLPYTPTEVLDRARNIALKSGIRYVYIGNVPGSPAEHTYCPNCKKMVIERKGFAILSRNLKGDCCGFCNTKIAGVWS
jgi:pyruvate formate lyase activating enzyme